MVKLSLLTVAACLGLNAGVIYTDFGAGQSYNTGVGISLGASRSIAAPFDPTTTGVLQQLDIALENNGASQPLSIMLETDASGPSGTVLDSWSVPAANIPVGPAIDTFTSTLNPTLNSGTLYWVVLSSSDPSNDYAWMDNDIAKHGISINTGSGWANNSDTTTPAFELDTASTPEPSTFLLGGLGFMTMAGLLRRRRKGKN